MKKRHFTSIRDDGSIAVHTDGLDEKDALLASDELKFFTTPHYDGYAMVLVRYAEVDAVELEELLTDSWRLRAPAKVLAAFDAQHPDGQADGPEGGRI